MPAGIDQEEAPRPRCRGTPWRSPGICDQGNPGLHRAMTNPSHQSGSDFQQVPLLNKRPQPSWQPPFQPQGELLFSMAWLPGVSILSRISQWSFYGPRRPGAQGLFTPLAST